ncbi:hypothetical protein [Vibrio paucivorans]
MKKRVYFFTLLVLIFISYKMFFEQNNDDKNIATKKIKTKEEIVRVLSLKKDVSKGQIIDSEHYQELDIEKSEVKKTLMVKEGYVFISRKDLTNGDIITSENTETLSKEEAISKVFGNQKKLKLYRLELSRDGDISYIGQDYKAFTRVDLIGIATNSSDLSGNKPLKKDFDDIKIELIAKDVLLDNSKVNENKITYDLYLTSKQYNKLILANKFMDVHVIPNDKTYDGMYLDAKDIMKKSKNIKEFRG